MQFICLMFITRGAAYEKIMRKSSDVMKQCMRIMKTKYNINTTQQRSSQTLDTKTITTPRIAASFPSITIGLFHIRGFGRIIFDPETMFPGISLPRAMFAPMISSMLPKTNKAPLAVVLAIATKVDDVLHQIGNKTNLIVLYQYMLASFNSTATTELLKVKYCVAWDIGSRSNGAFEYSEVIRACRDTAKNYIRALRPNDPELETVLAKI